MKRLRVACFALERGILDAVAPDKYEVVGRDPGVDDLPRLAPDVVLIAYPDFARSLERAEAALHKAPGASVLIVAGTEVVPEIALGAVRSGIADVLTNPDAAGVKAALERIWHRMQRVRSAQLDVPGKVVVVHSPKGGSGKSTLAANLSHLLATWGDRGTVLVDLALYGGDLDLLVDVKPHATWSDLTRYGNPGAEEVEAILGVSEGGVRLLAAPPHPEDADLVAVPVVGRALEVLKSRFGFVLIDTPATLSEPTLHALECADLILVPLPLTLPAVRATNRTFRLWHELGISQDGVRLVAWQQRGDLTVEAAEKLLKQKISFVVPYDPQAIDRAINTGQLMVGSAPAGPYAQALRSICREVAGPASKGTPRSKAKVLEWLVGKKKPSIVPG